MKPIIRPFWNATKWIAATLCLAALALTTPPNVNAGLNDWAPLDLGAQAQTGFNYVGVFDATNFITSVTNAANSAYNTVFPRLQSGAVNFPSGTRVRNIGLRVVAAVASGGGAASYALNFGDCSATNRFLSAVAVGTNTGSGVLTTNLYNIPGLIGYPTGTSPFWVVGGGTNFVYNTATNLSIWLLGPSENTNIVSGRFEIYLNAYNLNSANGL